MAVDCGCGGTCPMCRSSINYHTSVIMEEVKQQDVVEKAGGIKKKQQGRKKG